MAWTFHIGFKGKKHSKETLLKMKRAKIGKKRPPFSKEWIDNQRKSRYGYVHSDITKQKIGESNKEYFKEHPERAKSLSEKLKEAWKMNPNRKINTDGLKKGWELAKFRKEKKNNRICPVCNKNFYRRGNRIIKILCCSRKCSNKMREGENCHFWKDGKSREPYPMEWRISLRESIRKRDNFTCQVCS